MEDGMENTVGKLFMQPLSPKMSKPKLPRLDATKLYDQLDAGKTTNKVDNNNEINDRTNVQNDNHAEEMASAQSQDLVKEQAINKQHPQAPLTSPSTQNPSLNQPEELESKDRIPPPVQNLETSPRQENEENDIPEEIWEEGVFEDNPGHPSKNPQGNFGDERQSGHHERGPSVFFLFEKGRIIPNYK